ncbi:hypothetical protein IJJ27_01715 [bacterium]|nr:hypothetical protein [bacterium]
MMIETRIFELRKLLTTNEENVIKWEEENFEESEKCQIVREWEYRLEQFWMKIRLINTLVLKLTFHILGHLKITQL